MNAPLDGSGALSHATCTRIERLSAPYTPGGAVVPSSLPVIVFTALFSLVPALVLFWAYRRGFFRDLEGQSRVIFEPRDLRIERPWESPVERLTREVSHGELEPPRPGEWGGAS